MTELERQTTPQPQPSTVSPTRNIDGHPRAHQNLIKKVRYFDTLQA